MPHTKTKQYFEKKLKDIRNITFKFNQRPKAGELLIEIWEEKESCMQRDCEFCQFLEEFKPNIFKLMRWDSYTV